ILSLHPSYRTGGSGKDGTCDCIGLIIGALRRAGGKWPGLHGSNYAARKELVSLKRIDSSNDLSLGDLVFKAYVPSSKGYNLPARYKPGGSYFTGDLLDYYHVGVVTSKNPLHITHMTSPSAKVDTSLGKWSYHGFLKAFSKDEKKEGEEEMVEMVVSSQTGSTVYLRPEKSTSAPWLVKVPVGDHVFATVGDDGWAKVRWNDRNGYMMSRFLQPVDEPGIPAFSDPDLSMGEGTVVLTLVADKAQVLLPILESLTGQLVNQIGRG
ncbi:MAG: hypothetical protein IJ188_05515, partial [Clostridia bacterium]|nr:hypothetical protein [Clostridia bacterium]